MHDLRSEKERSLSDSMSYVSAGNPMKSPNGQHQPSHSHGYRHGKGVGFIWAVDYDANIVAQLNQDSQGSGPSSHTKP